MFRKLSELKAQEEGFNVGNSHYNFVENQNYRYNVLLPNVIPSGNTAPVSTAVNEVMRTVNPWNGKTSDPLPEVNRLFVQGTIPQSLEQQTTTCATASIDGLIASGSDSASTPIRCGWAYSPPQPGSAIPQTSVGALGTAKGPFLFTRPSKPYTQWYWDLGEAKKQILTDTCKALKRCSDVNSAQFNEICGFCTDIGQGIPVTRTGQPLYPDTNLTNCSPESIITKASNCPAPSAFRAMATDATCEPINGRLPVGCVEQIIAENGCTDRGALSLALDSGARPGDYMATARTLPSLQLYNRHMNPPLDIAMFAQPGTTVRTALSEHVRRIANAANSQPATSPLGASARDLCLQKGAIDSFDFCSELGDNTLPPYTLDCVRKVFLKAGGNPSGQLYPTEQTMASVYNTKPNWKAVRDFIDGLKARASGTALTEGFADMYTQTRDRYTQQADALIQLRGIRPEDLPSRPPNSAGVELFWFDTRTNVLLNVTHERNFPSFSSSGPISQAFGRSQYVQFVGLSDIRVRQNTPMKFKLTTDDGVIMSLNTPINLRGPNGVDRDGYFAINYLQAPTTHMNKTCWNLLGSAPNVLKVYWHDKGGGWHAFNLTGTGCGDSNYDTLRGLSLTRDTTGPFLMFENTPAGTFADLRMPEFFHFAGEFGNSMNKVQIQNTTDAKLRTPGKNGFVRLIGGSSYLALKNVSLQAWNTSTFVFRLNNAPVNDTLFSIRLTGGGQVVQAYLTPSAGGTCVLNYMTTVGGTRIVQQTGMRFAIGRWYMGVIQQNGSPSTSMSISFNEYDVAANTRDTWYTQSSRGFSVSNRGASLTAVPEQTEIVMGTQDSQGVLQWDLAWWHFFNIAVNGDIIQRDAMNSWKIV